MDEAAERRAYLKRLFRCEHMTDEEFARDFKPEDDRPPPAPVDPRWGVCRNCGRARHVPEPEGGCIRKMWCQGLKDEEMARLRFLDSLTPPDKETP